MLTIYILLHVIVIEGKQLDTPIKIGTTVLSLSLSLSLSLCVCTIDIDNLLLYEFLELCFPHMFRATYM